MSRASLFQFRPQSVYAAIEVLRHNLQHPDAPLELTLHETEGLLAVFEAAVEMAKASHTQDQERRWAAWDAVDAALGL